MSLHVHLFFFIHLACHLRDVGAADGHDTQVTIYATPSTSVEKGPALFETLKSSATAERSASTRLLVCRTRCRLLSLMRNVKVCIL